MSELRWNPNELSIRQWMRQIAKQYEERSGLSANMLICGERVWRYEGGRWVVKPQPRPWKHHNGRYPGRRKTR